MAIHREEHGPYLIEASAFQLPGENKWQPRLTMTRLNCTKTLSRSQTFPGLTPLFDSAKSATHYAVDLGKRMADEESPKLRV